MAQILHDIGMVGLGTMGRNLVLNLADQGFTVAGYDTDIEKSALLRDEAGSKTVSSFESLNEMILSLKKPRTVMLLVPAGPAVDIVINNLVPLLDTEDIIIDGGNSFYKDTEHREKILFSKGIFFIGMGISGGEEGARKGPCMMPGGNKGAYDRISRILEMTAAHVNNEPCVAYIGPGPSGHYVKMIHNGIEYGVLQLIAETYDLCRRGLDLDDDMLSGLYSQWNRTDLESYLLGITGSIFSHRDRVTGKPLIDQILDEAKQKGTGRWTCQDAMDLGIPISVIDSSVSSRYLSVKKDERMEASSFLGETRPYDGNPQAFLNHLQRAYHASILLTYAQCISLLKSASSAYSYGIDAAIVLKIWRGGCIIRTNLLDAIIEACNRSSDKINPLLDISFGERVRELVPSLREIVTAAIRMGIPVPAFSSALAYYDGYRSAWLPANLIQAQRDYFGAHTFERADQRGIFHEQWARLDGGAL